MALDISFSQPIPTSYAYEAPDDAPPVAINQSKTQTDVSSAPLAPDASIEDSIGAAENADKQLKSPTSNDYLHYAGEASSDSIFTFFGIKKTAAQKITESTNNVHRQHDFEAFIADKLKLACTSSNGNLTNDQQARVDKLANDLVDKLRTEAESSFTALMNIQNKEGLLAGANGLHSINGVGDPNLPKAETAYHEFSKINKQLEQAQKLKVGVHPQDYVIGNGEGQSFVQDVSKKIDSLGAAVATYQSLSAPLHQTPDQQSVLAKAFTQVLIKRADVKDLSNKLEGQITAAKDRLVIGGQSGLDAFNRFNSAEVQYAKVTQALQASAPLIPINPIISN